MDIQEALSCDQKYKYILRYFCNFKNDALCKKLSYNKCGLCNECYSQTDKIVHTEDEILEKFIEHKDLITKEIQTLLNECGLTIGKSNKVKIVFKIYNILFYNFLYLIRYQNILIININKLEEFFSLDKEYFINYCKDNKDDTLILNFMFEIHNFVKDNNYVLNKDIHTDLYTNFLEKFMSHMETYYDNIIKFKKNKENKDDIIDIIDIIDINNIDNCILQLDI